jgi:glutamyl-tRNA synthetase
MKKVKTRFSPSPTSVFKTDEYGNRVGGMHVGNLRNAIYSYLFAKQNNGSFILRIEDTDQKRSNNESVTDIIKTLTDFDLQWNEFYIQSDRIELYRYYAHWLVQQGFAYICDCNDNESCSCKYNQQNKKDGCIRLNIDKVKELDQTTITIKDSIRKKPIQYSYKSLYDIILLKSDNYPTYHLAATVDDHLMEVTHVFRSDEWLSSFPYHILLYKALGWEPPLFYHLPLLTNMNGEKLSKRDGDLSVRNLLESGFLPSAITEYIAMLGWMPSKDNLMEVYPLEQLINIFNTNGFQKSSCCYDIKKLRNINLKHARILESRSKLYFYNYLKLKSLSINSDLFNRLFELYKNGINVKELINSINSNEVRVLDTIFAGTYNKIIMNHNIDFRKEDHVDLFLYLLKQEGFTEKEIQENIRYMNTGCKTGIPAKDLLNILKIRTYY